MQKLDKSCPASPVGAAWNGCTMLRLFLETIFILFLLAQGTVQYKSGRGDSSWALCPIPSLFGILASSLVEVLWKGVMQGCGWQFVN